MTWLWIALAALLIGIGVLVPVLDRRRRHRLRSNDEAVAARSVHNKLGHHVETPVATDNEQAAVLLRQARERWVTAGSALAEAKTEEDFELAERIAAEGLTLVTDAYRRIGRRRP